MPATIKMTEDDVEIIEDDVVTVIVTVDENYWIRRSEIEDQCVNKNQHQHIGQMASLMSTNERLATQVERYREIRDDLRREIVASEMRREELEKKLRETEKLMNEYREAFMDESAKNDALKQELVESEIKRTQSQMACDINLNAHKATIADMTEDEALRESHAALHKISQKQAGEICDLRACLNAAKADAGKLAKILGLKIQE